MVFDAKQICHVNLSLELHIVINNGLPNILICFSNLRTSNILLTKCQLHFSSSLGQNLAVFLEYISFLKLCVQYVRKFSGFYLQNICRTLTFLSVSTLPTLVQAITIPHMCYSNSLLTGFLTSLSALLEPYLNIGARVILFKPKLYHIFSLLKKLQWLYISLSIKAKVLTMVFRPLPSCPLSLHLLLLL